jgi:hypothetical protein
MADALSMLGAGLGAASLLLQLTDECIKSKEIGDDQALLVLTAI